MPNNDAMVGQRKCWALHVLEGPDSGRTSLRYDSGIRTHNLLTFCSRSMRSTFVLQLLHKKRKDLGTKQKILPTSQERSSYRCFPFHSKLPNMGRQKPKKFKSWIRFSRIGRNRNIKDWSDAASVSLDVCPSILYLRCEKPTMKPNEGKTDSTQIFCLVKWTVYKSIFL